jgi:hypothetical protein
LRYLLLNPPDVVGNRCAASAWDYVVAVFHGVWNYPVSHILSNDDDPLARTRGVLRAVASLRQISDPVCGLGGLARPVGGLRRVRRLIGRLGGVRRGVDRPGGIRNIVRMHRGADECAAAGNERK